MNRDLLITQFLSSPWALMPEYLNAASAMVQRWASGASVSPEVLASVRADAQARNARMDQNQVAGGGAIAVLPFYGVVTQRGNMMDDICGPGSVSTQRFTQQFRQALADDTVGAILIDIDSPGGSVYGVSELADEIYQSRNVKPIVGLANSLCASAAYWVGTAAGELYVTPGGEVGSIGVWQAHFDYSKAMAEDGVTPTLISAGKFKVEGNPYNPLDEEAKAFLQSRVDDYYGTFTQGVSRNMGVPLSQVLDGMGQGRCLGADAALQQGMVAGIMTFDQVLAKMQQDLRSNPTSAKANGRRLAQAQAELMSLG